MAGQSRQQGFEAVAHLRSIPRERRGMSALEAGFACPGMAAGRNICLISKGIAMFLNQARAPVLWEEPGKGTLTVRGNRTDHREMLEHFTDSERTV